MRAWDMFVDSSPQGCVLCKSWWLDAVSPGRWAVLAVLAGDVIVGGFPHVLTRKFGWDAIVMPPLTQTLGVLLPPPDPGAKYESQLGREMEILKVLVAAIPICATFSTRCHHSLSNWLPFYWAGYRQTTRYTYVLDDLSSTDRLMEAMSPKTRNIIRKARQDGIAVTESDDVGLLLELVGMTFAAQGMKLPWPEETVRGLCKACFNNRAGVMFVARDGAGRAHSVLFAVYDSHGMYNLLQGRDRQHGHLGAGMLTQWTSIEYASRVTRQYDFEGSMIEGVEHMYRSFGARQKPYMAISRRSAGIEFLEAAKHLLMGRGRS